MKLLEIKQVTKRFPVEGGILRRPVGFVQALDHVSLSIEKGDTLGVVGGSGCGKSTLARVIMGLTAPDDGEVLWEGRRMTTFSPLERARRVQMIFQDPYASLNPKLSIGTQLREVVRLTQMQDVESRCLELLETIGMPADALSHYPFQFSGGQRQRIAIARALAMQPQLLIADEPLSSLDVTTQAQILDLFARLRVSSGLAFLFITHDLAVAYQFANRVIVLQEGRMVEEGTTFDVLRNPHHPYTRALLAAIPQVPC
jgi:peptide/nickel transport system ATP-binding protein/oligopeptide transport system ATP-binding protein